MFDRGETVGSLRAYFLLAGTVITLDDILRFSLAPANLVALIQTVASLGAGAICLYLAFDLKRLLLARSALAQQLVMILGALVVGSALFSLIVGEMGGVIRGLCGVLVAWYLWGNIRRIAASQAGAIEVTTHEIDSSTV